jgi:hypothetical protein
MSSLNNIKSKDDYMFAHQFHWFTGVIEDIMDPEQRGRYRVRCFGYHTEKKDYIPTTTLPWAHVMMPITSAAQCGVGESATGLLRGTWVIGFFRDGQTAQDPVIMGSIPSITPLVDYDFGFCDPVEQYPYETKIGNQDIPEEAISKDDVYKDSFSYKKKEEHRDLTPVAIAFDGTWELPPVDEIIRVEYPKNHVRAWERKVPLEPVDDDVDDVTGILDKDVKQVEFFNIDHGIDPKKEMHVQEFDVTPDWERISTMHRTGTYKEWTPIGDDTTVIVGNEYRIIVKNQHINVKGDCTLTVEGNLHTLVYQNEYRHIMGNLIEQIDGNHIQTVLGNVIETYVMNHIKTVTMNRMENVLMNTMSFTGMLDGNLIGMARATTVGLSDNLIVFGNKGTNVGGNHALAIAGTDSFLTVGPHRGDYLDNRVEVILKDSAESVHGVYTQAAAKDHAITGGASLSLTSAGPTTIIGNPVTINGRFPVLLA